MSLIDIRLATNRSSLRSNFCRGARKYNGIDAHTCINEKRGGTNVRVRIVRSIVQIDIYSEYMGRQELDGIAESIADILYNDNTVIDMTADGFQVVDGRIQSFETYEEAQYGYIGTITLEMTIQDLR